MARLSILHKTRKLVRVHCTAWRKNSNFRARQERLECEMYIKWQPGPTKPCHLKTIPLQFAVYVITSFQYLRAENSPGLYGCARRTVQHSLA